jgi:branched-chain amino acid transport system substrate-binding protein
MRRLCSLALGVLLAATAPAVQGAEPPYQINVIAGLTGGGSFIGQHGSASLRALEAVVNATGGIHGRPLQLVFHDDTSNPQVSVQLASQLLDQPVVIDISLAASCGAILPLIRNGPVHYCISNGVHPPPGSYMFTSAMWSSAMIEADLRYFLDRGLTKIGLITSTDASGQDAERSIDATLAEPEFKALHIVEREHFNTTDLEVDA